MTSFTVDHGPGHHNDTLLQNERESLRARLLSEPRTVRILSSIDLGVKALEESYPERLESYRTAIKGESLLRRLAREIMEGSSLCPTPPDGKLTLDEISQVANIPEAELTEILEAMHKADLLSRRQEVVFTCSTGSGSFFMHYPPESVSYGLTDLARDIISR